MNTSPMPTRYGVATTNRAAHLCWCGERAKWHQSFADGFNHEGNVCDKHINQNRPADA